MARRRLVVPGRPDARRLLRVESGDAAGGRGPRPSPDDVAVLRRGSNRRPTEFAAPVPARPHLSGEDVFRLVRDDLEKAGETDRPFYRYFTITHLANAGLAEDGLQTYRAGLSRLVNSLSSRYARSPCRRPLTGGTVFRIDLQITSGRRRCGRPSWPRIRKQPFRLRPWPRTARPRPAARCRSSGRLVRVRRRPAAAVPPGAATARDGRRAGEAAAGGRGPDIDQYRAARAGFNGSGVANANRLIERHPSNYGALLASYDFALIAPACGTFSSTHLAPATARPSSGPTAGGHFSLPNGLQGYLLADAAGRRIDKAPTDVVKDPRSRDGAVVTGVSCMACHVRGMIAKDDQIRDHVATNPGTFPKGEAEDVRALYPPARPVAALLRQDADRFAAAALAAGAGPGWDRPSGGPRVAVRLGPGPTWPPPRSGWARPRSWTG